MSEERGTFLFWFLAGLVAGGGLVFFFSTKEGKRILARLNLEGQEIEKIKKFLKNIAEEEQTEITTSNGETVEEKQDVGEIRKLEERGRLFGHRFFKKKKTP
ncbi:hypothetical protein A2Z23_00325 [Candidatus Curtissbacteria bacterium RBG_16_39_7]|uniref:Uncharacterized protein n=1 Tax=Candidatus Curtissbacteria bacterium RBG_16_39_7 TaxID=1797707 RepID=A0A1F5G376_9BACT|nr:MAG: hypothetical protein A2Z23_00325 [Candidatus Curtissbacteria bacterium RBG_16_39_7]